MITEITKGDIFAHDYQAIVNPVNCMGVSGKGLAKEFATRFPEQQKIYEEHCKAGLMRAGDIFAVPNGDKHIVYFATKLNWVNPSEYEWIATGLNELVEWCLNARVESIGVPALGCGLGQLSYEVVYMLVEGAFSRHGNRTHAYLFAPQGGVK